ncbi:uncharacterized protein LOC141686263 [Apium graveolens]|uniref:uncharacterized protein LOC141686263 n=1 Tax=Apium graveolens TaxID=4045 RepID=UPI003D79CEE3
MQLQYPVLFPWGDDGFHTKISLKKIKARNKVVTENESDEHERKNREYVSMKEYYNYKLMIRPLEGLTPHLGGRLWQQYVVDAFTAVEQYRLDWISRNQTTIRSDLYSSVRDALRKGDNDPDYVGKCIILPASFTGSPRYMSQYFKDSLALCRVIGHPTLFLTMTCNSKWPEIKEMMKHLPGVDVCDAPDIVTRVFKLKLEQLIEMIKKKNYFGRCIGKTGLPHCHMLIWLHPDDRPKNTDQIDALVSTEIPDKNKDPVGYAAVKNYMIHGPCGQDYTYSPCMVKGKCMRHFPKRYNVNTCFDDCGFPGYRRRSTAARINVKGTDLDNQYVVPFNRDLLVMFQCHINLEICNNSRSLKYLFKYCLKGHDHATMMLKKSKATASAGTRTLRKSLDEVQHYLSGRYVCASEASWRIFGFDIHSRWPSVDRLPVHLPDQKYVSFKTGESLHKVCDRATTKHTKLEVWFIANKEIPRAREFTYSEFPSQFTWLPRECKWKERQRGDVVGRLSEVHAIAGDLLYLRMLLMRRKGCLTFEDIRTVNGHVYDSFKETCAALGLLQDDRQWHEAMVENSESSFPNQLREMFVNILAYCSVTDPLALWNEHWRCMSGDIEHNRRRVMQDNNIRLSEFDIKNYALAEIEKLLNDVGKTLKDYPTMPFPPDLFRCTDQNQLIIEETSYNKAEMKEQHDINYDKLNVEQKQVYHSILDSIETEKGGLFFVYGSGGCGKTFHWQTICCHLRSENKIVLSVASFGISATLLPGGRTAHSRFHIPLKLDHQSTTGIKHGTDIAELLHHTSLIIWDEAHMQHRYSFECVDRSLRDIMSSVDPGRSNEPFGGITVVFGGDFRQILPVILKATRAEVVGATLNASTLWDHCQVFLLKQNMRLYCGNTAEQNKAIKDFSEWQLQVGNGKLDNSISGDNRSSVQFPVPEEYVVRCEDNPIQSLCDIVYPNFNQNLSSHSYLRSRAILTPTNVVVDDVNSVILDKIPGTTHTYLSQDSIEDANVEDNEFDDSFSVEYLNSLNMPCLPKHELKIKVGAAVMLMRNLNQILGLCNGTRMVVTGCKKNSIECQSLTGAHVGRKHLIP